MWLLDLIVPPRETEVLVRRATILELPLCPLSITGEAFSATALFSYKEPVVGALIREAKFHGNTRATHLLGQALSDYLLEYLGEAAPFTPDPVVLVPIPLSKERQRKRGYNQTERILRAMRITLPEVSIETEVLFRTRHTKEQTTLSQKERKENMRGAFSARDVSPGTRYILIDDVITTGATLFEASRAMQRAGATHITAIALAH
jgi:ComF family protein